MKKLSLFILSFLALLILGCKAHRENGSVKRTSELPNIVMIHIDDLGYHDLSYTGSEIYETPNIDKLASQSVVFENAYANFPRCVPSRYALLTATWPVTEKGVPDDGFALGNIPENRNLIKQIDEAGYHTAFFGKWHLGSGKNGPQAFGFDYSFAAGKAGSPISYFYPFNKPTNPNRKMNKDPMPDVDEVGEKGDYLNDLLTSQVIEHIKDNSSKPFFVALNHYAVHQPIEAKEKDAERNKKQIAAHDFGDRPEYIEEGTGRTKMRQDNAVYAGMVENMDENVGRLLDFLKASGLEENTIIIFSSDHGGLSNDGWKERNLATSNYPLRAGKGWLYEGGVRVPLFIKWESELKPETNSEDIVMLMDILPTLLDITTGKTVEDINGKSLLPVLKGDESWDDRTVFWHSDKARPRNTGESNASAIRSGKWKLVDFYEDDQTELYNLEIDKEEQNDLSEEFPEIRNRLYKELNKWKSDFSGD
ncbi:MAG: sulfatase [Christiangramia sp.]|nr:sulfatase [Christiangramia sp.]